MDNVFVADPALASQGGMLVNQIEVDGKPLPSEDDRLKEVVVTNTEGAHETAVITTRLMSTEVESMKQKTVAFTYGPRLNLGTFYGYSNDIVASKAYQQDGMYDISCYGSTKPLQNGEPRFYQNQTATQVIPDVVTSRRLGVMIETSTFPFPTLAQTDETDWAFISDVASRMGWVLYNYNGVVRVVDPLRVLNGTGPVLRLIRGNDALDPDRQLLEFDPSSASVDLSKYMTPVFSYFDGHGAVVLTHPLDDTHRLYTDQPIVNRAMADVALASWSTNPTIWTQNALGRIKGNPGVIPGTVVAIQTSGSSVIEHDYDGLWLVRGVTHNIVQQSFQTQIAMSRDDKIGRPTNVDYRPFWAASPYGRPQIIKRNGAWESNWKSVVSSTPVLATPNTLPNVVSNATWKAT